MKRSIRVALFLFVFFLAVCSGALAEGEKTEGDACPLLELNQAFFSRNAYTASDEELLVTSIVNGNDRENPVRIDVSFLSGDEALKGLYRWDPSMPDCLIITVPPEGTEGEATFHIRVETEHYYKEKDVTAKVMIFDRTPDTSPILIRAKVGKPVDPSPEILKRVPRGIEMIAIPAWTPDPDSVNPEFSDEGGNFTALEEGDYRLNVDLSIGFAGVTVQIPMVIYTGKSVSAETSQWLENRAGGVNTGAEKTDIFQGLTASAETGDQEQSGQDPEVREPAQPLDDSELSGYWTTSEFLVDGKQVDTKYQIDCSVFLSLNGKGYLAITSGAQYMGLRLIWNVTDVGLTAQGENNQTVPLPFIRNDDGSMTFGMGEYTFRLVQQEWPAELVEKTDVKAEDLTGKWVLCALDEGDLGPAPSDMISGAVKDRSLDGYRIFIRDGIVSFFMGEGEKRQVLPFSLVEEEGKLYADQLVTNSLKVPVTVYENNWMKFSPLGTTLFFVREDFWNFSITAKGSPKTAAAGKSVTFAAEFEQPERVKAEGTGITWSVKRQDGGDAADAASIDKKGVLKISRDLKEKVGLEVIGWSAGYTTASYLIEAVPVLKKLMITPEKASLYLGEEPLTLQVTADPAAAMPAEPEWKITGKGAELETAGDGSARITAVQAGKATVQVKDPASGKTAKMTVSVLEPVTAVEITGPATLRAGKSGSYKAALTPKKPGDKTVIWSVDVDESIAAVNKNGQVKVSKNAPAGTVITLTARAQGSPKEVLDTFQITVE